MPNSVDEKHSPSESYYPGETNYPNATFQGEDNAEQNSNKNGQEKVFSGLFYKVKKNCDPTKPYNEKPQAILSRTDRANEVNKSLFC